MACGGRDGDRTGGGTDAGGTPDTGAGDAMVADDASTGDAGGDTDAGPMCRDYPIVPYDTRPCSAETKACIEACTEPTCVDACIAADPARQCQDCVNRALISCFNRNGCGEGWNCMTECIQTNGCPMSPDYDACVRMHCAELEDAYYACIDANFDGPCPMRFVDCLPE